MFSKNRDRLLEDEASNGFTGEGFDEMDETRGEGWAELLEDGSIEIELA
jgi:hypothetical protein